MANTYFSHGKFNRVFFLTTICLIPCNPVFCATTIIFYKYILFKFNLIQLATKTTTVNDANLCALCWRYMVSLSLDVWPLSLVVTVYIWEYIWCTYDVWWHLRNDNCIQRSFVSLSAWIFLLSTKLMFRNGSSIVNGNFNGSISFSHYNTIHDGLVNCSAL